MNPPGSEVGLRTPGERGVTGGVGILTGRRTGKVGLGTVMGGGGIGAKGICGGFGAGVVVGPAGLHGEWALSSGWWGLGCGDRNFFTSLT